MEQGIATLGRNDTHYFPSLSALLLKGTVHKENICQGFFSPQPWSVESIVKINRRSGESGNRSSEMKRFTFL